MFHWDSVPEAEFEWSSVMPALTGLIFSEETGILRFAGQGEIRHEAEPIERQELPFGGQQAAFTSGPGTPAVRLL